MGRDDPLEEGTATHSSILAWEISWTEEPSGVHGGHEEQDTTEQLSMHATTVYLRAYTCTHTVLSH